MSDMGPSVPRLTDRGIKILQVTYLRFLFSKTTQSSRVSRSRKHFPSSKGSLVWGRGVL